MGKVSERPWARWALTTVLGSLFTAAFTLLVLGGTTILDGAQDEGDYATLAKQVHVKLSAISSRAEGTPSSALPEDAAAWLSVSGTTIDYPVAQASETDPNFYLSHDLWGEDSSSGCPYLDWRCGPNSKRALVYAHRMGTTGRQFSPIADTWKQEKFDEIEELTWTSDSGTTRLQPLCALKVDKSYQRIQDFDEQTTEELRAWLRMLMSDSSARAQEQDRLINEAHRAITLVTCSSTQGGQRDRTLLVFVC